MAATYLDSATFLKIIFFDASVPSYTTLATNTTTTTITLIPTTIAVGDILYFQPNPINGMGWKDMLFNIVTGHDGTITGVWEYNTSQNSLAAGNWIAVPNLIDGTKGFTLTGTRRVVFDSPDNHRDWFSGNIPGTNSGVAILRFRVTAVTAAPVTAATCNMTGSLTYSNAVVVDGYTSGTPGTIKNVYDTDVAGERIVAPPLPSTTGMTVAELFPGDTGAIRLNFILSGTTAGAGDTLDITGTGADGETITESIDVSGGDGTYLTTYSYTAITSFDCTGWTDGEVTVKQRKWGVVRRLQTIGNLLTASLAREYKIERAGFVVASTGYFKLTNELLIVERSLNDRRGLLATYGGFTSTSSAVILDNRAASYNSEAIGLWQSGISSTNTNVISNSAIIELRKTTGNDSHLIRGPISVTDTYIGGATQVQFFYSSSATSPAFTRSILNYGRWWTQGDSGSSHTGITVDYSDTSITGGIIIVFSFIAKNMTVASFAWQSQSNITVYLINFTILAGYPTSITAGSNNQVFRQYEYDLTVTDTQGVAISGATITATDSLGTQVFSVTTDANGVMATQTITHQLIRTANLGPLVTYSPFTISISKTGYQTKSYEITIDEKMEDIQALEAALPWIRGTDGAKYYNLAKSSSQNKFKWKKF